MIAFGAEDYLIAHGSRRIGVVKNATWFIAIQALMLLILGIFGFSSKNLDAAAIGLSALTGFSLVFSLLSFSKGLRTGSISIVVAIVAAYGAVTAILGIVFFKENITIAQIFYVCLIIIGTLLASFEAKGFVKRSLSRSNEWIKYSALALFGYGAYFFLLSLLSKEIGWFDAALLSVISALAFLLIYGTLRRVSMRISSSHFPLLLALAMFGLIGLFAYNLGTEYNYTSIVAPVSAAAPIVTIAIAMFLLRERLVVSQKIGIGMVVVGLVLLAV